MASAWLALGSIPAEAQPQAQPQPQAQAPSPPQGQADPPAPEDADEPGNTPPPPPDLVVLVDKVTPKGRYRLGVFGREADASQPRVWRIKLWEQTRDRLYIATDVLNCSPSQPLRITGRSGSGDGLLYVRELNPGGPITPSNRLDHQVWWAACFPDQAGKDPATLGAEARRLGYSGTLGERELVVPGPRRP